MNQSIIFDIKSVLLNYKMCFLPKSFRCLLGIREAEKSKLNCNNLFMHFEQNTQLMGRVRILILIVVRK